MFKGPFEIPALTDDALVALVKKCKPLVLRDGKIRKLRVIPHLRNTAFTWDPKLSIRTIKPEKLREVARVTTLHTWGYYGFFKPSIAECLAFMPKDLDADFFCIVEQPETASDLNAERDAVDAGFHVATTAFYKKV